MLIRELCGKNAIVKACFCKDLNFSDKYIGINVLQTGSSIQLAGINCLRILNLTL
mgnify:CR=1 FL=1